jgi:threonine/homoserine/homoserine lactone efflux protein
VELLLKGIAVGFAIAAPVGPIGLLCIRRTLSKGHLAGFFAGLGAAFADAVYGFVAAFGITLIGDMLVQHREWLGLGGGLFLCYLGLAEWRTKPSDPTLVTQRDAAGLIGGFASTFVLTLANPMTILSFAALFAGAGLAGAHRDLGDPGRDIEPMVQLVGGVFLGSAGWWLMLTTGIGSIRHHIGPVSLLWLNRISGTVLLGFGIYVFVEAVRVFLRQYF